MLEVGGSIPSPPTNPLGLADVRTRRSRRVTGVEARGRARGTSVEGAESRGLQSCLPGWRHPRWRRCGELHEVVRPWLPGRLDGASRRSVRGTSTSGWTVKARWCRAGRVHRLNLPAHNGGWLRFDGSRLAEQRGACFVKLERPELAEPALQEALRYDLSTRRRGLVLADLALVALQR